MVRILLVEDDEILLDLISEYLSENGYDVTTSNNAKDALDLAYEQNFDLLILDVKLPKGDGFSLLSSLRELGVSAPSIFTTSLNTIDDLEKGYKSGCDDYLKKPFELKELLIRIQALIKRNFSHQNGEKISISSKESDLLALFLQNKGKILTKDEIFNKIWKFDEEPSELSLRVYIKNLRQILGKDAILNRRGDGYIYV